MMGNKQENYFIDFLRFLFSLSILFYHSWVFAGAYGNGIFSYGYLAVDFYFIVTGYLMINSIYKNKKSKLSTLNESFNFIYKKVKKLFPSLLVTFIIGIVFVYGRSVFSDYELLLSNKLLPELFQLGIFGYDLSVNSSWWYISAMIFVLMLVYPLATKYKKEYCVYIAPLIIVFTLGIVNMYKININNPLGITLLLRNGFYKALIFIPLGNISYVLSNKIKDKNLSKYKSILLSVFEIVIYVILLLNLNRLHMGTFLYAVLLMINISITFSNVTIPSKIFKHSIWKKIGNYGFYIFLCNISIRTYMLKNYMHLNLTYNQLLICFVTITCITSLVIYLIVEILLKDYIFKIINRKKTG